MKVLELAKVTVEVVFSTMHRMDPGYNMELSALAHPRVAGQVTDWDCARSGIIYLLL